ncbi:MAG: response regulator [Lachnospiraceae bacterium]|nr:response regulator [Lachnospiraceae bacterium]MCR4932671.1 response regulator [Lachnospiraceae bacterium]
MYRVLIVEDEDIIRKGIAYTMDWTSMDCTIVGEAANGKEGLSEILNLKPDIVLADIMMPVMNGIDMVKEALKEVSFKTIILTSYADFDYAKKAIDLSVSAYLMKPVDEDELRASVKKIIEEIKIEHGYEQFIEKKKEMENPENVFIKGDKDNEYVQYVINETKENFADKISIEGFSSKLGVSASYLSRKFKEATGTSYLDFLNKYRVSQAVKLLQTGKYKVYEVSDMTGFTDYKHFNSVFKRYTDSSPSDFLN